MKYYLFNVNSDSIPSPQTIFASVNMLNAADWRKE